LRPLRGNGEQQSALHPERNTNAALVSNERFLPASQIEPIGKYEAEAAEGGTSRLMWLSCGPARTSTAKKTIGARD
jgi:hypothetical protein